MSQPRRKIIKKDSLRRDSGVSKKDRICKNIIEYGLLGLIIFSPLPAASVNEWSILVIQLTVLVLVAAYLIMKEKPVINYHISQILRWPKYLFIGFFLFLFIQILPLPHFFVRMINPGAYIFQSQFSIDISAMKLMSFSVSPFRTFREGMEILSYVLIGFLVLKTITSRRQIRRILFVLVGMGFFEAFYGLFELNRNNPRILFYPKEIAWDSVTGTFVNQNHFAGYVEMIIPLAIGLVIARIDLFALAEKKLHEKIVHFTQKGFFKNIVLTACVVIMSLSIFLSRSRSGTSLVVLTFVVFMGLTLVYFGRMSYRSVSIRRFLQVTFLIIAIFSLYAGIGKTIDRFSLDKQLLGGRPHYWGSVIHIIKDFPIVGSGLGTFAYVFPAYANTKTYGMLIHAHNDYFEYISELGLVGTFFLLSGLLFMAFKSFKFWYERRNAEIKGLALGGIISVIVVAAHSFTDFNLHIPANMLLFSVILSLTLVIATYNIPKKKRKKHRQFKRM